MAITEDKVTASLFNNSTLFSALLILLMLTIFPCFFFFINLFRILPNISLLSIHLFLRVLQPSLIFTWVFLKPRWQYIWSLLSYISQNHLPVVVILEYFNSYGIFISWKIPPMERLKPPRVFLEKTINSISNKISKYLSTRIFKIWYINIHSFYRVCNRFSTCLFESSQEQKRSFTSVYVTPEFPARGWFVWNSYKECLL